MKIPLWMATVGMVLVASMCLLLATKMASYHSCTVAVTIYEDGSWGGGALTYDGEVLDKAWDKNMPIWGYPAKVGNIECQPVLVPNMAEEAK